MFEDSFIESKRRFKTHRGWTTVATFIIEGLIVAALIIIPMIVTQALPIAQLSTMLVAPPPPPPPPPPPAASAPKAVRAAEPVVRSELTVPLKIPKKVAMIKDPPPEAAPPSLSGVTGGVEGGTPGGQIGGVIGGVIGSATAAVPKMAAPQRVRVSQGVSQGLLTRKVMPQYPPVARQARIQGSVVLQAVIGKDGSVQNLRVVSGHPLLNSAAVDAVKQWHYKPYMLNGEPTEVETTITVNFTLGA